VGSERGGEQEKKCVNENRALRRCNIESSVNKKWGMVVGEIPEPEENGGFPIEEKKGGKVGWTRT